MHLPSYDTLAVRLEHGILHVTLNRPQRKNALNARMVDELTSVFEAVDADCRAVVLRGAGGFFCAGADLSDLGGSTEGQPEDPVERMRVGNRRFGAMVEAADRLAPPFVVVVEGAAMGGGFGLVCVSDVALCHVDAKFGLPETRRGLIPAQIAPFVVGRVGWSQARKIALTGRTLRGRRAAELGLVHEAHETTGALDAALAQALQDIRACAPEANRATKAMMREVEASDLNPLLDRAAKQFAEALTGPEAGEGIAAFIEKRKPSWAEEGA